MRKVRVVALGIQSHTTTTDDPAVGVARGRDQAVYVSRSEVLRFRAIERCGVDAGCQYRGCSRSAHSYRGWLHCQEGGIFCGKCEQRGYHPNNTTHVIWTARSASCYERRVESANRRLGMITEWLGKLACKSNTIVKQESSILLSE